MTQNEFLNIIMDELKEFPELELQRLISFYKNKISFEISQGKNEEEVIKSFSDPHLICIDYKKNGFNSENNYSGFSNTNSQKSSSNDSINNLNIPSNSYLKSVNLDLDNKKQNNNIKNIKSSPKVNKLLKIFIIIFSIIIFFPFLTSILGIIIGILGVALSLLAGSIGVLIGGTFTNLLDIPNTPQFIADFPYPVIILITLGSICLSIFLIFIFYYSCKFFFRLCQKTICFLKSKGGFSDE